METGQYLEFPVASTESKRAAFARPAPVKNLFGMKFLLLRQEPDYGYPQLMWIPYNYGVPILGSVPVPMARVCWRLTMVPQWPGELVSLAVVAVNTARRLC